MQDISLIVPKGQFIGLLGRNGAGKSTLLRTIGGVYLPTAGMVRLGGPGSGIYEFGVPGGPFLTGRQLTRRWLSLVSSDVAESEALIPDIKAFSELDDYFDKPISTYSSGMKARLNFAVVTAKPSKIYLIDEVLSVGDEHFQAKCWRRLRERLEAGASGLLATHDWTAILKLCQTTCVLDQGRRVDYGPSREVVRRYLNLPQPDRRVARFSSGLSSEFRVRSGEDANLEISYEAFRDVPVHFACSVEYFRHGFSWEHLLHLEKTGTSICTGSYMIDLKLPALPLTEGQYSLNVFLGAPGPKGEVYDARSWTYGNDLRLTVIGRARNSPLVLPFSWRVLSRHDQTH